MQLKCQRLFHLLVRHFASEAAHNARFMKKRQWFAQKKIITKIMDGKRENDLFIVNDPNSTLYVKGLWKAGAKNLICTMLANDQDDMLKKTLSKKERKRLRVCTYDIFEPKHTLELITTEECILANYNDLTGITILTGGSFATAWGKTGRWFSNKLWKMLDSGFYRVKPVDWYCLMTTEAYTHLLNSTSLNGKLFLAFHNVRRCVQLKADNVVPHFNISNKVSKSRKQRQIPISKKVHLVHICPRLDLDLSRMEMQEFKVFLQQLKDEEMLYTKLESFIPDCMAVVQDVVDTDKEISKVLPEHLFQIFMKLHSLPQYEGSALDFIIQHGLTPSSKDTSRWKPYIYS